MVVLERPSAPCLQSKDEIRSVAGSGETEDIPGLGQYDDFQTIDWQRDLAKDRMRHRYLTKHKKDSVLDFIKSTHDAWSGWLCVFLVGLAAGEASRGNLQPSNTQPALMPVYIDFGLFETVAGTVASVIDIGTTWMTDLKYGICPEAFWLDREQCCWSSNRTQFDESCSQVRHPSLHVGAILIDCHRSVFEEMSHYGVSSVHLH